MKYSIHVRVSHRDPGHVHFDMFFGKAPDQTHAKAGSMILTPDEFEDFLVRLSPSRVTDSMAHPIHREDFHASLIDSARRVVTLPPHADATTDAERREIWIAQLRALLEQYDLEFPDA